MNKKDIPKRNIFAETFAGQEVEVFTGIMQKIPGVDEHGQQYEDNVPLVVRGFVIDMDEDGMVYLGDDTIGIVRAIKMGPGSIIEIVKEKSEFDDMLDNMDDGSVN